MGRFSNSPRTVLTCLKCPRTALRASWFEKQLATCQQLISRRRSNALQAASSPSPDRRADPPSASSASLSASQLYSAASRSGSDRPLSRSVTSADAASHWLSETSRYSGSPESFAAMSSAIPRAART